MNRINFDDLLSIAAACGIAVVGTARVDRLVDDGERLRAWQEAGFAGEMKYMQRDPLILADPSKLLPGAQSIVSLAISYPSKQREPLPKAHGRVARYAWGIDYHEIIPDLLGRFVQRVEVFLECSIAHRIATDAIPLLERAVARESGLGFVGKNTMLIASRRGSFFFLGEVLWDVVVEGVVTTGEPRGRCGECTRCLDGCPTGAFAAPFSLDARKCISYLTIEKSGVHPVADRRAVGDWLFGCDICQEVCPFNTAPLKIGGNYGHSFFERKEGALGPFLDLATILRLRSDADFGAMFSRSPLLRARRAGILRNAATVAANTLAETVLEELFDAAERDNSPTVRQTALWAVAEIARETSSASPGRIRTALQKGLRDPDSSVAQEAAQLLGGSP